MRMKRGFLWISEAGMVISGGKKSNGDNLKELICAWITKGERR